MPIEILMPALSPTMEEGTLSSWLVKEGDTIKSGDIIAEIETDKATMEVEAVDEGKIGKILIEAGTEGVKVNAVIALLLEDGETDADLKGAGEAASGAATGQPEAPKSQSKAPDAPKASGGAAASARPGVRADAPSSAAPPAGKAGDGDRIKASPLARRMARDAGVDLSSLQGSGPRGRIVKRDIEEARKAGGTSVASSKAAASTTQASPEAPKVDEHEPLARYGIAADRYDIVKADAIQKISAKRLTESFRDIPHFPLSVDCELDALLAFRQKVNSKAPEGVKVSVNDILIKAAGVALKRNPDANASWLDDGRIARHKHADVSVAVAIPGGLITPIIKDADQKGLVDISTEMKDLAARARDRKLKPEEFQGGTFSLSNLGMFGVKSFASIINPPQGMILSIGAGEPRPVVKDGALATATVMTVTLTCDHRVVDGATGARWLAAFKGFIEEPMTLLM